MTEVKPMVEQVKEDGVYVYSAEWCNPCKMLKATLDQKVDFTVVDIEEHSELAASKGIRGVPYTEIVKGGDTLKTFVGGNDAKEIIELGNGL